MMWIGFTDPLIDQAALYGLTKKVYDLGIPRVLVNRVEPSASTIPGTDPAGAPEIKR